ncbi:UPF0602 protein C4orf47 homolog isoform X2 [Lingula anatina]|uniref:Cilia-and flagella-associated protein 96 n=1 Tax=Lingula anatina TaxID=7574 RepID=A0A1S3HKS1_LINAN|nr:UPF0602 protein C4orf47 homolog isoform X2 [Lingula anatina]|eukprot:XP_013386617.1 UPF0602 protein C4orf47 homolog isoform X2 [Lingula anatina]
MGEKGGKTDMERIGVFQEMSYATIGDRYRRPGEIQFNVSASKGKQMLPGGSKERSALQHGYFHEKFNRVFESEAYTDPIKIRRQRRVKEMQKNIGKQFIPSSGEKMPSGLGNHYGTFAGPVSAFSPVAKARQGYKAPGRNFTTNPAKKGTGYGFISVTIGDYPKYSTEQYEKGKILQKRENEAHRKALKGGAFRLNMHPKAYFDGNPFMSDRPLPPAKKGVSKPPDVKPFRPSNPPKKAGGSKAGTFDPYPSHSQDPYGIKYKRPVHVVNKTGKIFVPSTGPKTAPISSILDQNVTKVVNSMNYRTVRSVTYG